MFTVRLNCHVVHCIDDRYGVWHDLIDLLNPCGNKVRRARLKCLTYILVGCSLARMMLSAQSCILSLHDFQSLAI